jgi:hypothetical protein
MRDITSFTSELGDMPSSSAASNGVADRLSFAPQSQQTAGVPAEIRASLVDFWTQIFAAEIRAGFEPTVGTPGGQNRE